MKKRGSFALQKRDWVVIGALLLLAAGCWLFYRFTYRPPQEQNLAVIMIDGKEVMRLNLLEETDRIFSLRRIMGYRCLFRSKTIEFGLSRSHVPTTSAKMRGIYLWKGKARCVCQTALL